MIMWYVYRLRHIHNAGRKQQRMTEVRWCSRDLSTCFHRCEHFGIELSMWCLSAVTYDVDRYFLDSRFIHMPYTCTSSVSPQNWDLFLLPFLFFILRLPMESFNIFSLLYNNKPSLTIWMKNNIIMVWGVQRMEI
jgi:hypothetical protein